MNKLRDYVGIFAICATSLIFTGCGDDDNDAPGNQGPVTVAPESLAGRTYTLTDSAGASTLAFDANGTAYTLTPTGAAADTGTWTGQRAGDVWTVNTVSGSSTNTSTLTLNFSSDTAGNFELRQGDAAPVTGTFAQSSGNPNPPDPNPDGVPAPATLNSMTVTANGAVYTITFSGGTSGTFTAVNPEGNSMGSGNYVYTPSGNNANLRLTYPEAGDEYDDMNLAFTQAAGSGQPNNFTGTQKIGGTVSPFSGTFTY